MDKEITTISLISKKDNSSVELVNFVGETELYILKKYAHFDVLETIEDIRKLDSVHFPHIENVWKKDGNICVLEEYVAGDTLRQLLDEHKISKENMLDYSLQLCDALNVLHSNEPKLVHRDVKPENIIISKDGILNLIDFDAARTYKFENIHDTILMGTRGYTSPEQFGFQQTDERSDIYSAGIVLKEMLDACVTSKKDGVITEDGKDESLIKNIRKIVEKATMFDPDSRYSSILEMKKDIERASANKCNRSIVVAFMGVSTLLIAVVAALFIFFNKPKPNYDFATLDKFVSELYHEGYIYTFEQDHFCFVGIRDEYDYQKKIYIPSEISDIPVSEIGPKALAGKNDIEEVHIPESVNIISKDSFLLCRAVFYIKKGSYAEEFFQGRGYEYVTEDN